MKVRVKNYFEIKDVPPKEDTFVCRVCGQKFSVHFGLNETFPYSPLAKHMICLECNNAYHGIGDEYGNDFQ